MEIQIRWFIISKFLLFHKINIHEFGDLLFTWIVHYITLSQTEIHFLCIMLCGFGVKWFLRDFWLTQLPLIEC